MRQIEILLEKSFQLGRKDTTLPSHAPYSIVQYALLFVLQILHLSLRPAFQGTFITSSQMVLSKFRKRSLVIKRSYKYLCLRSLSVRIFDDFDLIPKSNHRKLELQNSITRLSSYSTSIHQNIAGLFRLSFLSLATSKSIMSR